MGEKWASRSAPSPPYVTALTAVAWGLKSLQFSSSSCACLTLNRLPRGRGLRPPYPREKKFLAQVGRLPLFSGVPREGCPFQTRTLSH